MVYDKFFTKCSTRKRLRICWKLPAPTLSQILRPARLTKPLPHPLKRAANCTKNYQIGSLIHQGNTAVAYFLLYNIHRYNETLRGTWLIISNRFIFFIPLVTSPCLLVRKLVVVESVQFFITNRVFGFVFLLL